MKILRILPGRKLNFIKIYFCLGLTLYITGGTLHAQSKKRVIDSIFQDISEAKEDTNKVKLYLSLVRIYYQNHSDSFFIYGHKGLDLSRTLNWKKGIANTTNNLGLLISDTGNHELALTYLKESLILNKEIGSKVNTINNLTNIGRIYYRQADFAKAAGYFFDALEIAESIQDHEKIAMIGTNLTATFCSQKDFAKGEKYAEMVLYHSALAKAPSHTFKGFIAMGEIKAGLLDTTASKDNFRKALRVAEDNELTLLSAEALTNLAKLETDYDSALVLMLKARKIFDAFNPTSLNSIVNLEDIGGLYMHLFQSPKHVWGKATYLKKAEYYLTDKIQKCRELNYIEALASGLKHLAKVQEWKGDYRLAYKYNEQYHAINDSLYSQESKNKIATIEGQREVALRDKEIELNKQTLATQRQRQIALTSGVGLLAVIGLLLYRQNQLRKTTNSRLVKTNQELDEANKTKTKFFAILSHDLRGPIARLISFLRLQREEPGMLTREQVEVHQQKITTSAEKLLDNMEDLLLWSKAQMEQFKPALKRITVGDLFGQVRESIGVDGDIRIIFSNAGDEVLFTDENFVRTILQNLTNNAIHALEGRPGATIEWKAWREGEHVLLSIADNGPGISKQVVNDMLSNRSISSSKSGFGFHIIRDLAQAIDCQISAESPGAGTVFTLRFAAQQGTLSNRD